MKIKVLIQLTLIILLCEASFGQNITNTLGTNGLFTIKNSLTTYFTLSQANGYVTIPYSLNIGAFEFGDTTKGVIRKDGLRFIHNYRNATNLYAGINSGNFSFTASGNNNTGVGYTSLYSITTGTNNSAVGSQSLYSNINGNFNSAIGYQSMYSNTSGVYNSALGYQSLYLNTTGGNNTAFGVLSLYRNTTGSGNSAFGSNAMGIITPSINLTGNNNSAFGLNAGKNITTGSNNTVLGYNVGGNFFDIYNNSVGVGSLINLEANNCIAIGNDIEIYGTNSIAMGNNVDVFQSNYIRLGNTSIAIASIQVPWSISSDRRFKTNISNSQLGLSFITKLRPVSYTRINDESNTTEYGFIAQEVEEVLRESGEENAGIISVDSKGMYSIRYNDMIAPTVKAVQELNEQVQVMNEQVQTLTEENKLLKERLAEYEKTQQMLVKKLGLDKVEVGQK